MANSSHGEDTAQAELRTSWSMEMEEIPKEFWSQKKQETMQKGPKMGYCEKCKHELLWSIQTYQMHWTPESIMTLLVTV